MKIPATMSMSTTALYDFFQVGIVRPYAVTLPTNAEMTVAGTAYSRLFPIPRSRVSVAVCHFSSVNPDGPGGANGAVSMIAVPVLNDVTRPDSMGTR